METRSSVKDVIPDIGGNFTVDQSIMHHLPKGARILEASTFGTSAWTRTARIAVELEDGTSKSYFLKCAAEGGAMMMEGEYNSMNELYKLVPRSVPKPYAWGKFQLKVPETHFFLCEFVDMDHELPDPVQFCARIAEIHRTSVSPTGQFGFQVPNCHGKIPQIVDWDYSWASFFARLLESFFHKEVEINGSWPEYEKKFKEVLADVVPQLLEPLQAQGRQLKPCLVHGDLWEENTATNLATGEPVVFDASCLYAHNEYELGTWRREVVKFGRLYFNQYLRHIPPSEPVDQWDDRIRLYSLKFLLAHMIGWPGAPFVRDRIYNDMCYLVDRYPRTARDSKT